MYFIPQCDVSSFFRNALLFVFLFEPGLISSGISVERSPYSCDAAFGHVFGDVIGTGTIHYRVECNLPYCESIYTVMHMKYTHPYIYIKF